MYCIDRIPARDKIYRSERWEQNDFGPGWATPVIGVASRKAHYYTAGFRGSSLCGKYVMLGGVREDHTHYSPDNCTECMRRYYVKHPELELPRHLRRVRVELVESVIGRTVAPESVDGCTAWTRPNWRRRPSAAPRWTFSRVARSVACSPTRPTCGLSMPEMPRRSIRADDTTWGRAKRLAHATGETGVSVSEWIRDAINRAWSDRGLEPMDTQENDR